MCTTRPEGRSKQRVFALISKLTHCWTGPYKVLLVGPGKMDDGREVGRKLVLLEIRQDDPGRAINARVDARSVVLPMTERPHRYFCRGP